MFGEVVFVSRMGTRNIGDNLCSPYLYFKERFPKSRQVEFHLGECERNRWYLKTVLSPILIRSRLLIVGGGGLLGLRLFADDLRFWSSAPLCAKVLWGPGHNAHNILTVDQQDPADYQYARMHRFKLIGIRDWGMGYNWVPCSSCMHPEFSLPHSAKGGLVAALHYETRSAEAFTRELIATGRQRVDVVFNDSNPELFIGKLRNATAVVTNSYHAAYWATLLGKRVAVVGGGSKVRMLKHQPVMSSVGDWVKRLDEAQIYPHALEECRDRNVDYCNQVAGTYQ